MGWSSMGCFHPLELGEVQSFELRKWAERGEMGAERGESKADKGTCSFETSRYKDAIQKCGSC